LIKVMLGVTALFWECMLVGVAIASTPIAENEPDIDDTTAEEE